MAEKHDLQQSINNIEELIKRLIDEPIEGVDVNQLVRDYNIIRRAVTEVLVDHRK